MTSEFRRVSSAPNGVSARAVTALGLSTLLILNGMPAVMAARSPAGGTVEPRPLFHEAHGLPLVVAARLARVRALLASSTALQDPAGCGIQTSDAVRFLEQATFGPSFATDPSDPNYPVSVTHLTTDTCYEGWLQEQFKAPVLYPDDPTIPAQGTNYYSPSDPGACDDGAGGGGLCWSPPNPTNCTNNGPSTCNRDNYTAYLLQTQFFTNALTGPDQLRQRVAWALTQIDVVSEVDSIRPASWMTPYLQLFDHDAFGNYRQLLYDLTVNPAMGEYLNMRGNNYSATRNTVNENYAREILQLFSVGLNKLNDDGTVKTDSNGPIPTYSQDDITNLAHVFTGWGLDAQLAPGVPNYSSPMITTSPNNHDTRDKVVLGQATGGGDAATELTPALDIIFNHQNVGPFIGKQLIQKLVTSNPSPAYVGRVTAAFNSGTYTGPSGASFGSGARGDMQAVIASVLLDQEARTAPPDPTTYGHLREPVLFITNTLRALGGVLAADGSSTTDFVLGDQFLPSGANANIRMDQDVFRPPTVFSYYPPDNRLAGSSLLAPELAIQSTSTSLAHINFIYDVVYHKMPTNAKNSPIGTWIDTTPYEPESAGDASALINDLNMRLMHGSMSAHLHDIVLAAVQAIPEADATGRVRQAIYLMASSSSYQVER